MTEARSSLSESPRAPSRSGVDGEADPRNRATKPPELALLPPRPVTRRTSESDPLAFTLSSSPLLPAFRAPDTATRCEHGRQTRCKPSPRFGMCTLSGEHLLHTNLPHWRQWCRRLVSVNLAEHSMHRLDSLSATQTGAAAIDDRLLATIALPRGLDLGDEGEDVDPLLREPAARTVPPVGGDDPADGGSRPDELFPPPLPPPASSERPATTSAHDCRRRRSTVPRAGDENALDTVPRCATAGDVPPPSSSESSSSSTPATCSASACASDAATDAHAFSTDFSMAPTHVLRPCSSSASRTNDLDGVAMRKRVSEPATGAARTLVSGNHLATRYLAPTPSARWAYSSRSEKRNTCRGLFSFLHTFCSRPSFTKMRRTSGSLSNPCRRRPSSFIFSSDSAARIASFTASASAEMAVSAQWSEK
mmetsp:Transcript_7113/g.22775  ORF Transcript_7113/g.22775 Transcript_7113/m.22775 type:complete len:421 (-) Transcript_7113:237-1499(-)